MHDRNFITTIDWHSLGDGAWISSDLAGGTSDGLALAAAIRRAEIPGVLDVTNGFRNLAVYFNPDHGRSIREHLREIQDGSQPSQTSRKEIEIPIRFGGDEGPDLRDVAAFLGLSCEDLIGTLTSLKFTVAAIGFSPGFPYLTGLPETWHVPRKSSPRPVPAGSLAIAGNQLCIYPNDSPGGWHLLGRSDLYLFDPGKEFPTLLEPGDVVRFCIGNATRRSRNDTAKVPDTGGIEILEPGPLTSIQDLGRTGHRHVGVTQGGAMDPISASLANLLVGNPEGHAVLECCLSGPLLRFANDSTVAWLGWNGSEEGRPVRIRAGETLDLRTRTRTLRGYLAVNGGIDVPLLLGSRATDLRAGFGGLRGRTLRQGDILPVGPRTIIRPSEKPQWRIASPSHHAVGAPLELRVLTGLQAAWFTEQSREAFLSGSYTPSPQSDRMGIRLEGEKLQRIDARELVSQPVAPGSIQVPPDGKPIVLMAECQTLGGYPQIAHVIRADLMKLANIWPGTPLRFREVTLSESRAAWDTLHREIALLRTGITLALHS